MHDHPVCVCWPWAQHCGPGCPWTENLLVCVAWILGLQICATKCGCKQWFPSSIYMLTWLGWLIPTASVNVLGFFSPAPIPAGQKEGGEVGCSFLSPLPTLSSFPLEWMTLQRPTEKFCTDLFLLPRRQIPGITVYTSELAKLATGHFSLSQQTFKITVSRGLLRKEDSRASLQTLLFLLG